jgi:signal transduction histidine kinase
MNGLRRLWPHSLAGQMIALLLLAIVAAQAFSVLLFWDERRHALRAAERTHAMTRTLSIVRLLGETPPELGSRITESASDPHLHFDLGAESALDPQNPAYTANPVRNRLAALLEDAKARQVLVRIEDSDAAAFAFWRERRERFWRTPRRDDDDDDEARERKSPWWARRDGHDDHHPARRLVRPPLSLTIAVQLADGRWLNAATLLPRPTATWAWYTITLMAIMAAAVCAIVILSVRRITRPMRALAAAAERLGRGEDVPPLDETGPADIRGTTQAFNQMNERLHRFVRDRTRMLAAISHDLRTPITTLRLRAEFIEDAETRDKVLETLAEMQEMIEGVLSFVREDAAREDTRPIDMGALIASLCDDLADNGLEVEFANPPSPPIVYRCRPVALKRALNNVIENAVKYGKRAHVTLSEDANWIEMTIDDEGPGIPEADLERVFEPFQRLEESRSRETGGTGLGLAIARSIARGHGGNIVLSNRPAGGLRATIQLPRST